VAIGIFLGLSIILLYNRSLRSGRNLESLLHQDQRSYYLAESGFHLAHARLRQKPYAKRWYAPEPRFAEVSPFGDQPVGGEAVFQYFLTEVALKGVFSHIFLLVRGIYHEGPRPGGGTPGKTITLLKGKLKFLPFPANEGQEQELYVLEKAPLNGAKLLEFIEDPRYQAFFKNQGQKTDQLIQALLGFLKDNPLRALDPTLHIQAAMGAAQLEHLNTLFRRARRISILSSNPALDSSIPLVSGVQAPGFPADPMDLVNALDPKSDSFGQLSIPVDPLSLASPHSSKPLDSLRQSLSTLVPSRKNRLLLSEYLTMFESLPESVLIHANFTGSTPISLPVTSSPSELISLIAQDLHRGGKARPLIQGLEDGRIRIEFAGRRELNLQELKQLSDFKWSMDSIFSTTSEASSSPPLEETTHSSYSGSGAATSSGGAHSSENPSTRDPYSDPLDPENLQEIIQEKTGDLFAGIDPDSGPNLDNLGEGFVKVFYERLRSDAEEFAAYQVATTGQEPSRSDWDRFFQDHPQPNRSVVEKVGQVLNGLYQSQDYSFHYGAHVRDYIKYDHKPVFTEVEWSREEFREELLSKLLYFRQPVRTNAEFLELFRKCAWGDSLASSSMGKDQSDKAHSDYFLINKETGNRELLYDYLRNRL